MRGAFKVISITLCCAALAAVAACASQQQSGGKAGGPGSSKELTPDQIQSEVMSFADTYATRMDELIDRLMAGTTDVKLRAGLHQIKIQSVVGAYAIASSPNPGVALLDMCAYVRLKRQIMQEHGPQIAPPIPESAEIVQALVESYTRSENEMWDVAKRVLSAQQLAELDELIRRWRAENPDQYRVTQVRLSEFSATRRLAPGGNKSAPGSLFSLFYLDPLSNLEPTAREIEQTRRIAERAFFVAERMPMVMAWQVEQVVYDGAATHEAQQLLEDAQTLATASDRFSLAVDRWPQDLSRQGDEIIQRLSSALAAERQAAIEQITKALEDQRGKLLEELHASEGVLRNLLAESKQTLDSGREAADALTKAMQAIDALANPPPGIPGEESHPFDPREYGEMAVQVKQAALSVDDLLKTLERLSKADDSSDAGRGLNIAFDSAEAGGQRLIDRAFYRALILVVILIVGVPTAMLAYRWASRRMG